jgi:hypothetical protein
MGAAWIRAQLEADLAVEPERPSHVSDGELEPLTARCSYCGRPLAAISACPSCVSILRETAGQPIHLVLERLGGTR